jgi:predicted secreted protein
MSTARCLPRPLFAVLCAISLLFLGCGNRTGHAAQPVEVTESASGSEVELLEGQILEIVLSENPSTGYGWKVGSYDAEVLEQLGSGSYTPDETGTGRVGSGGEICLRFKGVRAGETELKLGNVPPGGGKPDDEFELNVRVVASQDAEEHGTEEHGTESGSEE